MRIGICGALLLVSIPAGAQPAAEEAPERGWRVLEAALKAAGGREKLAAVQDLWFELDSHVIAPQGEFDVRSVSRMVFPSTVRQDSRLPFGDVSLALDGTSGWMKGPQGATEIPAADLRRMQADLARGNVLFRPPADRAAVRWVGEESVTGRQCDVIEIANVGGEPMRLSADRETGHIIKRSYRAEAPGGGGLANVEELVSDFREVDGLRLSFKVRVMRDGKLSRESVTRSMKVNTGLSAQELMRRPAG